MIEDVNVEDEDPPIFLLLDDHPSRNREFQEEISGDEVNIQIIAEAIELEAIRNDLEVLDGAIIDFHLNTPKKPGYTHLRYPCNEQNCPDLAAAGVSDDDIASAQQEHAWHTTVGIPSVDVTTGLGAMLYVKQHAPNIALYGFCELNADHSLLFLTAAQLWLNASAINAEYEADQIKRALTSDNPEDHLPIHEQLMQASAGFEKLTKSLDFLTRPVEAFDWLDVYRLCGYRGSLAEFEHLLEDRFGPQTLESRVYIKIMKRWQGAFGDILKAFGKDVSHWPDLRDVKTAKHWDKHNPVLDFLKDKDYRTFFTAPDMRAALAYYRANKERELDEDPFGGY